MTTSVTLKPDVEARLDALAKQAGRAKAFHIRELIEEHIEDFEDYYLPHAAYERVRRGEEKVYSSEEGERCLVWTIEMCGAPLPCLPLGRN